ncbi:hypothetical protein ACAW74_18145 [Fibrella sp. WM1]|uniref:hypothetical protein n=1 Tax=Fibrella musci TaxID=3242485 RepID=UPI0035219AAB
MNELRYQIFNLRNEITGQTHRAYGVPAAQSFACQLNRPGGLVTFHMTVSEALGLAYPGDSVMLLRDCYEYIVLRNQVNINGNGFSLFSAINGPLMTDAGQTVNCQVTNFLVMSSTYVGGVSEWNALIMLTGTDSNVLVQGNALRTPAAAQNWNGKAAIVSGAGAILTLRVKRIQANAVEVGGSNTRIYVEDGLFISPNAASYAYRVDAGGRGYVFFTNMDIRVKNMLTYDQRCNVTWNNCKIVSERDGFIARTDCRYTLINCQTLTQTSATYQAETKPIHQFTDAGQVLELIGSNVFVSRGSAASWIGFANAGTAQIMGKVVSNKPTPGSNFNPAVGTAANGSILVDAAADLKFLP